jgi:hypothetical protein
MTAVHLERTATIHLKAPLARVFPLFTPLGEKHWAADWNPRIDYPASGQPVVGAVFRTQHPGETEATWIVVQYSPETGLISYARWLPNSHAGLITVQCRPVDNGVEHVATLATVTYALTVLGEAGEQYLTQLEESHYHAMLMGWENAINHFLQHGEILPHH